jgi:uncharacterized protein
MLPPVTQVSSSSHPIAAAIQPRDRIDAIDAVRGVALFGVLVVNVLTAFRISLFQQFLRDPPHEANGLDRFVESLVSFGFEMKAFSLFSILFGLGLAMQFERFSRSGHPFYFLGRRLIALLVFGAIHLLLIWNGDILTEYALAGLVVLPLLRLSRSSLAAIAVGVLTLYGVLAVLPPLVPSPGPGALAQHVADANNVLAHGSFLEILKFEFREIELLLPLHVSVFPRTVGLFVFGALIWRSGVIQQVRDSDGVFGFVAAIGILVGVTLTSRAGDPFLQRLAPVVLAIGYGSLIVWIAQIEGIRPLLAPFASVGRMAFTNYILQSVVFSCIFLGYGFGLFGRMGAALALLLVAIVYSLQAAFSTFWLSRFQFGPLEWLWRTITYNRIQQMRIGSPSNPALRRV